MNTKFKLPPTLDLNREYTDEELLEFIPKESYKPNSKLSVFSDWYVVDGIPVVPESKIEKLQTFFKKYFKSFEECDIIVDDGKSTGLMFIKSSLDLLEFDDKLMDKKHTLTIMKLIDFFDENVEIVKDCTPSQSVQNDLVIYAGGKAIEADLKEMTQIEFQQKNTKLYKQQYTYVKDEWIYIGNKQYKHPHAKDYFISPNQQFAVSWSTVPINSVDDRMPYEYDGKHILVWNLNGFCVFGLEMTELSMVQDVLKFTDDDAYVVFNDNNQLLIHDLTTNTSKSFPVNANKFQIQPNLYGKDHKLAYFTKGQQSTPSRVCLIDFNNLVLRSKNLFNVTECELYFDPRGVYLLATLIKINKSRKVIGTALELFKLKDKGFPVESMEFVQERVTHVAWDPKSSKLVLVAVNEQKLQQQRIITSNARREEITAEEVATNGVPNNQTIKFMQVHGKQCLQELLVLSDTSYNYASYSPAGRIVVLCGVRSLIKGNMLFFDTGASDGVPLTRELIIQNNTVKPKKMVGDDAQGTFVTLSVQRERVVEIAASVHYRISKLTWDPTGRYLCTLSVVGTDSGYKIFDLTGTERAKHTVKHVEDVMWTIQEPLVLDAVKSKKIKQSLTNYISRFEAEDDSAQRETSKAEMDKIENGWIEWQAFREKAKKWRIETKEIRYNTSKQEFGKVGEMSLKDYYSDTEDLISDLKPDDDKYGYLETVEVV